MRAAVPARHSGLVTQRPCGSPGFLLIWTSCSHRVIGESLFEFHISCLDYSVDPFVHATVRLSVQISTMLMSCLQSMGHKGYTSSTY
jgi:hypothetical protein